SDSDAGENERERQIYRPDPAPPAPEGGQQGSAHEQVRGREDEQRHGVEIDSLVLGGHWALLMIRSAVSGVEPTRPQSYFREVTLLLATWKDGPDGLLE